MKTKLTIVLITILLHAQFILAQTYSGKSDDTVAQKNTIDTHRIHHWGSIHKTGVIVTSAGVVLIVGAYVLANQRSPVNNNADAAGILIVGVLSLFLGGGLTIGGAISDHNHAHHHLTLIAPIQNQVGLAYNF